MMNFMEFMFGSVKKNKVPEGAIDLACTCADAWPLIQMHGGSYRGHGLQVLGRVRRKAIHLIR